MSPALMLSMQLSLSCCWIVFLIFSPPHLCQWEQIKPQPSKWQIELTHLLKLFKKTEPKWSLNLLQSWIDKWIYTKRISTYSDKCGSICCFSLSNITVNMLILDKTRHLKHITNSGKLCWTLFTIFWCFKDQTDQYRFK